MVAEAYAHDHPFMNKRNLATFLWFLAGWAGGSMVTGIYGLPSILAFTPGIVLAGLIWWDPNGALWHRGRTDQRVARPVDEFADDLERQAAQGARGETDSIPV